MQGNVIWNLVPSALFPLVLIGAAFALMFGLIRLRTVFGIIGLIALRSLLSPFFKMVLGALPIWVLLLLVPFVVISVLRGLSALLIGHRASDHMMGNLAAGVVRGFFSAFLLPLRLLGWLIRVALRV